MALLQTATPAAPGSSGMSMIMLVGMIAVFYFLIFAPQRKQRKKEEQMRSSLKKGDKVVTIGGIKGVVSHVSEENGDVIVKVDENTKLTFKKAAIGAVEGEPKPADAKDKKKEKAEKDKNKEKEAAPEEQNKQV